MPATFFGQEVTEITFHGQQIEEVTYHGDVVWSASDADWRASTTILDSFENYTSQADLESNWSFGVAPAAYTLNTTDPVAHQQDMMAQQDTAHAPREDISTPWGSTFSIVFRPGDGNNSPGMSVQHQPNYNARLDDCYWCRADFGNNELGIFDRTNGSGSTFVTDAMPSGLSSANRYRLQVDLRDSDNNVRARLFNYGDNPDEVSPIANTGYGNPGTTHSGGHIMLDSGREGAGNTQFDILREH